MVSVRRQWGQAIREVRKSQKRSQAWLAQQVGVDQSAVSLWETGVRAPSLEIQLEIARALGIPARVLFQYPAEVA